MLKQIQIKKLLNSRFLLVFSSAFLALIASVVIQDIYQQIDIEIIFPALSIGIFFSLFYLEKIINSTPLLYVALQLILFPIFLDFKIAKITGMSFKIYGIVFVFAFISAAYHLLTNFKYYWKNYASFKYIFIFFIINTIYAGFYHSDFREWGASFLQMYNMSHSFFDKTDTVGPRVFNNYEFSETGVIGTYLVGIIPVISYTIGLTLYNGLEKTDKIKALIEKIIIALPLAIISLIALAILTIFLKISTISFVYGRFWSDFFGIQVGYNIYLAYYVILLTGLKYYAFIAQIKRKKLFDLLYNITVPVSIFLILLQISKTTIIGLILSFVVLIFSLYFSKIKLNVFFKMPKNSFLTWFVCIGLGLSAIYLIKDSNFFAKISDRFFNNDTLSSRIDLWNAYITHCLANLDIIKFFFGFGLDYSSENAIYYGINLPSSGEQLPPHIHNVYLKTISEYGLSGLTYFAFYGSLIKSNIKEILLERTDKIIKIFCCLSLSAIGFSLFYFSSDLFRLPFAITLFSMLGFIESSKFILKQHISYQ